jgi:hypothetical protein
MDPRPCVMRCPCPGARTTAAVLRDGCAVALCEYLKPKLILSDVVRCQYEGEPSE